MKKSLKSKATIIDGHYVSIETLVDKVNHPRKYDCYINVPGSFDAAEYLLKNHYADLNDKTKLNVAKILARSGKYKIEEPA
jgi:hypothetical protein